jgi:hypothetical protein
VSKTISKTTSEEGVGKGVPFDSTVSISSFVGGDGLLAGVSPFEPELSWPSVGFPAVQSTIGGGDGFGGPPSFGTLTDIGTPTYKSP